MTEKNENKINRRQFLGITWLASVAAFAGETLVALFRFIQPVNDGGFGGIIKVGMVDDFAPGSVTLVKEGRFYLSRLEDGSFMALWQRCTHLGCSIPWAEEKDQYHCPCHGSLFNKMGEVQGGPAPRPMDYFPVIIENGEVLVNTEEAFERKAFDSSQTTSA